MEQAFIPTNRFKVFRSKLFSLSTISSFTCDSNYTYEYTWTLNKTDTSELINLSNNPTHKKTELVVPAYTLLYGYYEFKFQVNMILINSGITLSNTALTYIQIIPTGLAIFAIENGVSSQLIGAEQPFVLNPAEY